MNIELKVSPSNIDTKLLSTLSYFQPFSNSPNILHSLMYQLRTYKGDFTNFKQTYRRPIHPTISSFKWININFGMIAIIVRKLNPTKMIIPITLNVNHTSSSIFSKFGLLRFSCTSVRRWKVVVIIIRVPRPFRKYFWN